MIQEGVGVGGPIDGFDISVYHVETDFFLGLNMQDNQEIRQTRNYIWPVCFPRTESEILEAGGTNR